jgi:long-chain acyl-CoA synthetase
MFPGRWLPAALGVMEEPFSEENRMLNSTMKMVRKKVVERYRDLIDYLFTPKGKNIVNDKNLEVIKKLLEG